MLNKINIDSCFKVRTSLEEFFQYYLKERNIEKTLSMVTDDIYSLGTGEHEVSYSKKEFEVLLKEELLLDSTPIDFEIKNYLEI